MQFLEEASFLAYPAPKIHLCLLTISLGPVLVQWSSLVCVPCLTSPFRAHCTSRGSCLGKNRQAKRSAHVRNGI